MIAFKINALRQKLRRQFYSAQNVIEFISSLALFVDSSLQLHSLDDEESQEIIRLIFHIIDIGGFLEYLGSHLPDDFIFVTPDN